VGVGAVVFANGVFNLETLSQVHNIDQCDVWCIDGGLRHAVAANIQPHFIVGDCDSVSADILQAAIDGGAQLTQHPANKDASDLELGLHALVEAGYADVTLLAASGGRTDHALFNWLLVLQKDWPFRFRIIDATVDAFLVSAGRPYNTQLNSNTTLSLIARETVTGITTDGLVYPLSNATIEGGQTLGLSNLAVGDKPVTVSVKTGRLLACVVRELN